jgi:hypothetical protein
MTADQEAGAPALGPTPYRPRIIDNFVGRPVNDDPARRWLALRPGETQREWHARMSHTCWRCGHFDEDNAALDTHEVGHQK